MMRLIDADSMIQSIENNEYYTDKLKRVMNSIVDSRPTVDAVPVVRCKECKWWRGPIYGNRCSYHSGPPITQNFTMRTSFVPVVSAKEGTSDGVLS